MSCLPELAICVRCGAEKDLPLGRCPACGSVPVGEERLVALVCSARVSDEDVLRAAQERIRRGEPIRPSAALLDRARRVLSGVEDATTSLTGRQLLGLFALDLLVTPLVGYALWYHFRNDRGPAARQALVVTLPASVLLAVALVAWHTTWLSA